MYCRLMMVVVQLESRSMWTWSNLGSGVENMPRGALMCRCILDLWHAMQILGQSLTWHFTACQTKRWVTKCRVALMPGWDKLCRVKNCTSVLAGDTRVRITCGNVTDNPTLRSGTFLKWSDVELVHGLCSSSSRCWASAMVVQLMMLDASRALTSVRSRL